MLLTDARLFHVNVNCSDLERSRRFYTEGLGLHLGVRTAPETSQPGAAFGLERARWDASILLGPRGYDGGAIDLLQWHEPTPVGAPPARIVETGFQRLGLRVPDLDAAGVRVGAFGGEVWGEPLTHTLADGADLHITMANDPDGTALELVEGELVEGEAASLSFVAITCADLEKSHEFYRSLGFREVARYPSENADGSHLHIRGAVAMDEIVLTAPGGGDVLVILVGFRAPSCEPAAVRAANTLGMWRAAFLVADVDAAVAELARHEIATISAPVDMAMGPGLPTLRFVCFHGPDHEVVELIERPAP